MLNETYVCIACSKKIERIKQPACVKCARPLAPYDDRRSVCGPCRSERPHYDRGFALILYQEPAKALFHQIKYGRKPWLLKIFVQELQTFSRLPEMSTYDRIVPIPLHVARERQRGFNQALLIAQMIRRFQGRNLRVAKVLLKKKNTCPQSLLPRTERLKNLTGAFSIKKRTRVRDEHILLIDDVVTTGSTVNECAKILKAQGARRVDFLAIARSHTS